MELEAPLAHLLAGVLFLLQAAALGTAMLVGLVSTRTGLAAYVILLLLGWAAGVTLGHLGKLLSLSLWVWWPPGPRPKQNALYPRRVWLAEAAAFASGVEVLAIGALAGQPRGRGRRRRAARRRSAARSHRRRPDVGQALVDHVLSFKRL